MIPLLSILATQPLLAQQDGGGSDLTKIIFPIIFLLIWILSAVASVLGKRQREKERRRKLETATMRERMQVGAEGRWPGTEIPVPPPQRPAPPPPPRPIAMPPRQPPMPPRQVPPPSPKRPVERQRRTPTPPPAPRGPAPVAATNPSLPPLLYSAMTDAAPPRTARLARAATMSGSIGAENDARRGPRSTALHAALTPTTLRQQIILMELLGKPVALRDPPDQP